MTTDDRCRHCHLRAAMRYKRRLCFKCYGTPVIRQMYPSTSKYAPYSAERREPTAAEIEALVAEQSRPENLPAWWARDVGRD